MLDEQRTTRRRLSRARVCTVGALVALTAAGTGLGLARAEAGDPPGTIRTIAGVTTNYRQGGFSGDGGKASDAQLYNPRAVAFSKAGDVYVGDAMNNRIRKIDTGGNINTIVGSDNKKGRPDGPAETAVLKFPKSMYMTPDDVLYICNTGGNTILKIDLKASPLTVKRVAGNLYAKRYGGDGKFATDAQLNTPQGVWATQDGSVYISDSENNLVRKVTPDGKIATIVGDTAAAQRAADSGQYPIPGDSSGDGGPATAAHLNGPRGIAVDEGGNVYIAEEAGARIRRIDPSGKITTIAGNGKTKPDGHDPHIPGDPGPAPALEAQFHTMHDLNLDKDGSLWIADSKNNRVRMVTDPANAPAGNLPAETSPSAPPQSPPPSDGSGGGAQATTSTTAAPDTTATTAAPSTTTTTPADADASTTTTTAAAKAEPSTTTTTPAAQSADGPPADGQPADDTPSEPPKSS
jgi:serine/threonine-protein kinase